VAVRSTTLAKLTRPKLYDALPRTRLFSLLDEAATRPIVWICAPPGSGKSTLVASYLEARGLPHLWYQYDAGDADTATFVHYMRIATQQLAGKAAAALPLFSSESQENLARFARVFFRDVFSALPHPCAVVFDNFHEPRTLSEQRAAFAQGLEEIPEGITLIVMSRSDPPPEFARLVASRRIARIDEVELRCTANEAEAILGSKHLDRQNLQRIQQQSDGWVAAIVLKAQQRPLDLLKLLAALGGKDVDIEHLTAMLWPDADGAAAKSSFDSALFRLRKLLDVDNALVLPAGKLSLDRALAWTDVWTLEAALEAAESAGDANATDAPPARAARRLLDAYPGPLLGAEESPWIAKPRDALRARFVRTLLRLGEKLERQGDWVTAIDLYRRGLEADNLAESLYRGLTR